MEWYLKLQSLIESNNLSWKFLLPEFFLLLFFLLGLIIDLFWKPSKLLPLLMLAGLAMSGYFTFLQISTLNQAQQLFNGMLLLNNKTIIFKLLLTLVSFIFLVYSLTDQRVKQQRISEYFYLVPLFLIALNMLCMSSHLLSIYLSLEMVSLFSYGYVALAIVFKRF